MAPSAASRHSLTPKQSRFVDEYLVDLNAAQAAIRAGYSAKSATVEGSRLLANAKVKAVVAAAIEARSAKTGITAQQVVQELARIGFSDMRKFTAWGPDGVLLHDSFVLGDAEATCVAEVSQTKTDGGGGTLRFKLHDKIGALTLLAKHLGMLTEKHEITGKDGGPVQVWRFGEKSVAF